MKLSRFLPDLLPGVDAFKEVLGIAGMLRDPHAIQNIYRVEDGILRNDATKAMLDHLRQQPGTAEMMKRRYLRGEPVDVKPLRELPEGSLGREFARHIDDYGFATDYYQQIAADADFAEGVDPDIIYALNRVRETHDIWHVVLGFAPTPIGELGLKAFETAQLHRPMAAMIVGGGICRYAVVGGGQYDEALEAITAGFRMGKVAKPLLAETWEDCWSEPVEQIRARLGVELPSDRALGREDPKGVKPSHREEY